jgi:hypothetical protein
MRIEQLYSNFGHGFSDAITKKYNFKPYNDPTKPVFVFGCYGERQVHNALTMAMTSPLVVICWGGSDAKILKDLELSGEIGRSFWSNALRSKTNIKHIAISHWIAEDMEILRLPYHNIRILPHDNSDIVPCAKGDSIYMYRPDLATYNGGIYQKIKDILPYKFIETNSGTYSRKQLIEAYKNCFIGLRFTEHDGLSNTVCELGLMGRKVIHNGDAPNCIHYHPNDIASIVDNINHEFKNRNELLCLAPEPIYDYDATAISVKRFLNISDDFLNTEYYVDSSSTSLE